MFYPCVLSKGKLVRRYKRFLADVELDCGKVETIYCPNTGAMTHCAEPGSDLWYSDSNNPKRKYRYTWEQVRDCWGARVGVHSALANAVVGESLRSGQLAALEAKINPSSWLTELENIHEEHPVTDKSVRFDFFITTAKGPLMVEVKSVTLADVNAVGCFPDAVTQRGLKQVKAMIQMQSEGVRSLLVYCVQHSSVKSFNLAQDIDPAYAKAVREFKQRGGRVLVVGCQLDDKQIIIDRHIPWITS